jgi:hypothetical protein
MLSSARNKIHIQITYLIHFPNLYSLSDLAVQEQAGTACSP